MSNEKNLSVIPINAGEFRKFFCVSFMMVLIIGIYSILRANKDVFVMSFLTSETISTLKLWGVFPSSVLFILIFTKIVDKFTRTQLFHGLNFIFMTFFLVFGIFLYPRHDLVSIDVSELVLSYPKLRYFFMVMGKWHISLFFIMSELWGTVMLSLMFWQLANQICSIDESRRFYPLFGFVGQIGLLVSSGVNFGASRIGDPNTSVYFITVVVVVGGILLSMLLVLLGNTIGNDVINGVNLNKGKKKVKLGFFESIKEIFTSRYIALVALLIVCYGISINLVENAWKKVVELEFTTLSSKQAFQALLQMLTAVMTALSMILSSYMLRKFSWKTSAMFTPVMIFLTGTIFFILLYYYNLNVNQHEDGSLFTIGGFGVLFVAVYVGMIQNVMSKGVKYAFFDPTKEMAYIPLDETLKTKGKAAADVVGGRLGKSGGAFVQWLLLTLSPVGTSLIELSPKIMFIFVFVMVIWFWTASSLSKEFEALKESTEKGEKATA